jgi:hypothetical protein
MAAMNGRCAPSTEPAILTSSEPINRGARSMTRLFLCLTTCLTLLPALDAGAVEMPIRKAGLWEMKVLRTGSSLPEMTMQHCTDETTDKEMSTTFSPMAKEMCSKQDIQKTATGYVSDSVCKVGAMSITSHSDINGDFNSGYTVKSTSHNEGGPANVPRDSTTTVEAKWLGACKADQKPGDIVMPGGMKMNVKDMEKLKALMPKSN